jgi:hypothetical protein
VELANGPAPLVASIGHLRSPVDGDLVEFVLMDDEVGGSARPMVAGATIMSSRPG